MLVSVVYLICLPSTESSISCSSSYADSCISLLGNSVGKILGEIAQAGIFRGGKRDQVMFFPSTSASTSSTSTSSISTSMTTPTPPSTNKEKPIQSKNNSDSNPEFLNKTLHIVEDLLLPRIPEDVFRLLFDDDDHHHHDQSPTQTTHHHNPHPRSQRQRQSILNLYPLPQSLSHSSHSSPYNNGITPHVDLPGRYADGIVGVCLGSGVALGFEEVDLGCVSGGEEGGLWGEGVEEEEDEEQEEEDGDEEEEEGGEDEDEEEKTEVDADERAPPRTEYRSPVLPPSPSKPNSTNLRIKNKKKKKRKKKKRPTSYEVYLPKGTIYILSGEARWSWMHGIEARGEDLVWDDEGGDDDSDSEGDSEGEGDSESEGDDGDGSESEGCSADGDKPERRQTGRLEETSSLGPSVDNPRKRKRTLITTRSKRTKQRTATRILRDTRVSITYRWLKPQPRHGTNRPRDGGHEDVEADGGYGGILLEDPVGEGDDWNVR